MVPKQSIWIPSYIDLGRWRARPDCHRISIDIACVPTSFIHGFHGIIHDTYHQWWHVSGIYHEPVYDSWIHSMKNVPLHKIGVDQFSSVVRNAAKEDFLNENSRPGRIYSGGLICLFKGVEVPCMCWWTPKGSTDGAVILDILKTLDILEVYSTEREQGLKPIILVYVHGNRYNLDLLECIHTPETE